MRQENFSPLFSQNKSLRGLPSITQWAPYLLSPLAVLVSTCILVFLRNVLNLPTISLLFLLPVGLCTVFWGFGPGVLSSFFAFLALNFFFINPYYSLSVKHPQDLLALFVFLAVAVLISQLVGRTRMSLEQAQERERDTLRLYELSNVLSSLHNENEIVQTIADHVMKSFRANRVDILLEPQSSEKKPIQFSITSALWQQAGGDEAGSKPHIVIPMETVRGFLGEICLWRSASVISPAEERLLRAFANQAVLSLERVQLSHAETRAQVLEESDRMKSALLSSVSHELRSPLATIKASVTSLRSGAVEWDTDARQDLLAAIEEETDHLNQLVGNLLNMSRIEAGALHLERAWNDLREIINGVIHRMRTRISTSPNLSRHEIVVDVPPDLPLVAVDYILIEQVFTNLISNSLKYSPENTKIQILAKKMGREAVLVEVTNQGPQIPEDQLERIFDKFNRITASDRITGAGLGLSICKGIIEAHGGLIWAKNLPHGLSFHFTLPITWEGAPPRVPDE